MKCAPKFIVKTGKELSLFLSPQIFWLNEKFPLNLHFFLNRIVAGYEIYCRLQLGYFITLHCFKLHQKHSSFHTRHKIYLGHMDGDPLKIAMSIDTLFEFLNKSELWKHVDKRLKESPVSIYDPVWWVCGDIWFVYLILDNPQLQCTVNGLIQDIFPQTWYFSCDWFILERITCRERGDPIITRGSK